MTTLADFAPWTAGSYRNGGYISMLCPYHDDSSPSLLAYADGRFYCKGCHKAGTLDMLLKQLSGTPSRPKPQTYSPKWLGLPPTKAGERELIETAHQTLLDNPSLGWYLEQRGLNGAIRPARLGYWKGWITIPIYQEDGVMDGFMLRATPNVQTRTNLRFVDVGHQGGRLYVPSWPNLRTANELLLVYGMFDALSLMVMDFAAATTTAGKDSFDPTWLDSYRKRVWVAGDEGEEGAARRRVLMHGLGWRGKPLDLAWPNGIKDVNNFLEKGQTERLREQLHGQGIREVRADRPADAALQVGSQLHVRDGKGTRNTPSGSLRVKVGQPKTQGTKGGTGI